MSRDGYRAKDYMMLQSHAYMDSMMEENSCEIHHSSITRLKDEF